MGRESFRSRPAGERRESSTTLPSTSTVAAADRDRFEIDAQRVAGAALSRRESAPAWSAASAPAGIVQRQARRGGTPDAPQADAGEPRPPVTGRSSWIADDATEPGPRQMRKGAFLTAVRRTACAEVDAALAGTGRDSQGCPWIEHWIGYYDDRSAAQVEQALRRYAPETASATSADECVHMVGVRIRTSAVRYAKSGTLGDLPASLPRLPGHSPLDAFGGMFFKTRPGGAVADDPQAVRAELGDGQHLPSAVRAPMESLFGATFSGVHLHADTRGARVAERLNARAFTVGRHVAFGADEFRPGTPAGDALIAHELAHVVQQGEGGHATTASEASAEADADRSAAHAVGALWGRARQSARGLATEALPRVRSGLALRRCGKSARQKDIDRLGALQLGYLEDKRKAEEARLKKEADDEAKKKGLPPPATAPKVDLADVVKKDVGEHAIKGGPTAEWDAADQPAWRKRADAAWAAVKASVKGTELEKIVTGITFKFEPAKALTGGYYAWYVNNTLNVGMSWVRLAEKDPKNAWENLAHEVGGHSRYGQTYSSEIMTAALSKLNAADRARVIGDSQRFFETYSYPETEIYASLWQRRYRKPEVGPEPESGGIHPDANIAIRLNVMKDALHPQVARAVLAELARRINENDQILARDKDYFRSEVKKVFGYSL